MLLADFLRKNVREDVGGDGVEAALGDDDGVVAGGEVVVFGNHVVDPGDFARAVEIVRAVFCARGQDGFAVQQEGSDGGNDEFGFFGEGVELGFFEFAGFDVWYMLDLFPR